MQRASIVAIVCLTAAIGTGPSFAQARDPFSPPGVGGGASGGAPAQAGGSHAQPQTGVVPTADGGSLPRTGLDLEVPLVASTALLLAGSMMRIAARRLAFASP